MHNKKFGYGSSGAGGVHTDSAQSPVGDPSHSTIV